MSAPEAVSIRCGRCGGTFGYLPYPGNARCPYCAHEQPVSAELLADLRRYAGNVGRELAGADEAYQRAAAWEQWTGQGQRSAPNLKVVIPIVSGVTLLTAIAIPITQELGIPPDQVRVVVTPLLTLPVLMIMGYVLWAYSGRGVAAKRATAGNVAVACPNCGARTELVAGAPSQVCAYCRAALVASPLVMEQGVDAAELAHRRARLEEFRQQRLGMVAIYRNDMTAYVPFIVGGSLLLPAGGGALAFSVAMLTGEEPYSPAIFVLWGIVLAIAGGLAFVVLRRRSFHRRCRNALADLGRQFPLHVLEDAHGLADWLNRHWPAEYDVTWLTKGPTFAAASIDAQGYPALLNADFTDEEGRDPRLHVLLSAHQRAGHVPHADALAFIQRTFAFCRQLGFEVTPGEAGLFAAANAETLRIVRRNPEALHELAPLLGALASAARAAGAVPAERAS